MSKHLSNDEKNTIDFLYPLREKRLKKEFPKINCIIGEIKFDFKLEFID